MRKSVLFLGVGVLLLSLFRLPGSEPVPPQNSDGKQRYAMFSPPAVSGGIPEVFVLDTLTGRIWRRTIFTDVKGTYMVPLPYLSADQLSASAAPTGSEAFETLSMQKQYNAEVEQARQRAALSQPAPSANPSGHLR